jgi:hypothetical protein
MLLLGLLVAAGCSSSKRGGTEAEKGRADELRELATILPLYSGEHRRGPSKPSDLAPYEAGAPLGYRAVAAGDIVVVWGATMAGEGEKSTSTAVVAYEKKTPTEGGFVLLHNGDVKQMTAEEFKNAPKAGK